jgi:alkylation response protein AidB-like acyl-CoA dehydrogenase
MAVRHAIYLRKLPTPSTTTQIYEGTNQIRRMVMARQLLK